MAKPNFWIKAVQRWNYNNQFNGWCIPKKGTKTYAEVKAIADRMKQDYERNN